ncbi:uncharacterized protein Bfra_000792 [Botrytis fragariae]|uniref:BTB domain-containing protein n=1 Tax=Botrytis fragariae TaxID=1964551 RepID=A0A8H6ENQ0_9HELO|nr:uncharacterized protein Bfra_000792 [Botrytis fragariae]KAF5878625.1 hypothetical protein Bfra_000792 [Botrytis fragariae]
METPLETSLENPLKNEKSKILMFMLESKTTASETEKNLYEGPTATIIVGPAEKSTKYIVPQALLCHHSKFFDRALNGPFKESIEKHVELPEETTEEFELLLEWIYCKKVPCFPGRKGIDTIVKFYTIADKFDVAGPYEKVEMNLRTMLANLWHHTCMHNGAWAYDILESVYQLPIGHEAQRLFGKACVRPYLVYEYRMKGPPYDYTSTILRFMPPLLPPGPEWLNVKAAFDTIDGLAIEVVKALGETLVHGKLGDRQGLECYQDPLTGQRMRAIHISSFMQECDTICWIARMDNRFQTVVASSFANRAKGLSYISGKKKVNLGGFTILSKSKFKFLIFLWKIVYTMDNSRLPVSGTSSILPTPTCLLNTAEVCNKAPIVRDDQTGPLGSTSLLRSNSAQSDFIPNRSTKLSDTMATFNHSASKMLGSPTEYNSAKNNSQENTTSTVSQFSANNSATNRSPLAILAPPTMNTSTFMSPARSVPAMPARSNLFGSSTVGLNFESFRSRADSNTPNTQEVQSSETLFTNASPQIQSDTVNAPPQKRAKTTHNIAAQLPANEFTNRLDLFRGPEVLVTAGIQLGVKSYLIPKALLIQASPYFQTAITVETLGQITRETLKIECSILAFDFVVQYLYTGTFVRPDIAGFSSGSQQVTNLIEFYELAEKLSLDISDMILDDIKELLVIDRLYLQAGHIHKVVNFPNGQKLRMLFARSCIQAYLQSVNPTDGQAQAFRFQKELDALDGFAADLMRVYREVADKRTPYIFAESRDLLDGKKFSY